MILAASAALGKSPSHMQNSPTYQSSPAFGGCPDNVFSDQTFKRDSYVYLTHLCHLNLDQPLNLGQVLNNLDRFEVIKTFPNLGYKTAPTWLLFTIRNDSTDLELATLLDIGVPTLSRIELFELSPDTKPVSLGVTGGNVLWKDRPVESTKNTFKVSVASQDVRTFLAKVESSHTTHYLTVRAHAPFSMAADGLDVGSLYYGWTFLILICSIFLSFIVRKPIYGLYSLFVLSTCLHQIYIDGYWQFSNPWLQNWYILYCGYLFATAVIVFLVLYVVKILAVEPSLSTFSKVAARAVLTIAAIMTLFLLVFEQPPNNSFVVFFFLDFCSSFCLAACWELLKKSAVLVLFFAA